MNSYELLIDGTWHKGGSPLPVINKYTGETVATVATARKNEVDAAIAAAVRAKQTMADMPAWKRAEVLLRAASLPARAS